MYAHLGGSPTLAYGDHKKVAVTALVRSARRTKPRIWGFKGLVFSASRI